MAVMALTAGAAMSRIKTVLRDFHRWRWQVYQLMAVMIRLINRDATITGVAIFREIGVDMVTWSYGNRACSWRGWPVRVLRIRVTKAVLTFEFGKWGKYYKISAMPILGVNAYLQNYHWRRRIYAGLKDRYRPIAAGHAWLLYGDEYSKIKLDTGQSETFMNLR